jgi:hypothetical protein
MMRTSFGSSSEPQVVDLAAVEAGAELPDSHIAVGPHLAFFKAHAEHAGNVIYPVASLADGASFPTEDFEVANAMRRSRLLIKASAGDLGSGFLPEVSLEEGASGLVLGTAETALDVDARNRLKREMGVSSVHDLPVLELGRKPSTLLGLLSILGGAVMFVVGAWTALSVVNESDSRQIGERF